MPEWHTADLCLELGRDVLTHILIRLTHVAVDLILLDGLDELREISLCLLLQLG